MTSMLKFYMEWEHHYPSVNVQKINCVNSNTNINGVEVTQLPPPTGNAATAQAEENVPENENGNGLPVGINLDRRLVNICANVTLMDK